MWGRKVLARSENMAPCYRIRLDAYYVIINGFHPHNHAGAIVRPQGIPRNPQLIKKYYCSRRGWSFRCFWYLVTRFCVITSPNFSPTGIPTFRGAGGMWRRYNAMELATPDGFAESPSLVWQFYHYRRETLVNHSHTYNAIEACLELSRPTRMMPIGLSPRSRSLRSEIRSRQNPALNS